MFLISHTLKNSFAAILIMSLIISLFLWQSISFYMANSKPYNYPDLSKYKSKICSVNYNDTRPYIRNDVKFNTIYFVTPTYPRAEQIPELVRLSHTLMLVPKVHWIVADDQPICSEIVIDLLKRTGLPFTHISSPNRYHLKKISTFPRGVSNREAAIAWIKKNIKRGILYFGDDDNAVDLRLFDEIRNTKALSMFPVGLIGNYGVSSPVVRNGKVVGFFDSWPAHRVFPVDMAGFAINIEHLKSTASMPYVAGHEEDGFLISNNFKVEDIEPLADNCTKIYVWHTKTKKFKKPILKVKQNNQNNFEQLYKLIEEVSKTNMASVQHNEGITAYVTHGDDKFSI